MNRRKFLIGAGSIAAGSAAAMGTGAFTSVSADRTMEVQVSDDADALLAIDDIDDSPNSEYVDTSGNTVSIDIASAEGGTGLNDDAKTIIKDLLKITNQGTQNVYVWAEGLPTDPSVKFGVQDSSDIENDGTGAGENQGAFSSNSNLDTDDIDDDEGDGQEEAAPLVAPGGHVDVEAFALGDLEGLDFDGTITIKAVAEDEA
ncbi:MULTISPECIES: hypothetical protein [Haloarcula]|uniref:hypothetical protein n=1 Tax=Haloarcula TaxID=2237 RepID=UPI0023E77A2B|nr:hypothetical protein [Halomicroarcula sp. SHR3]